MQYAQGISEAKPASVTVDECILQYKKFSDLFLCLHINTHLHIEKPKNENF